MNDTIDMLLEAADSLVGDTEEETAINGYTLDEAVAILEAADEIMGALNEDASNRYYTKKADRAQAFLDKADLSAAYFVQHPELKTKVDNARRIVAFNYTSEKQKELNKLLVAEANYLKKAYPLLSKKELIAMARKNLLGGAHTSNRDTLGGWHPSSPIHDVINRNMEIKNNKKKK